MTGQRVAKDDSGEKIKTSLYSFEEVKRMINDGQGMLGYSRELFASIDSLSDLQTSGEFKGKEVDR